MKRTLSLFGVILLLSACSGYTPLYQITQNATQSVSVGPIKMRDIEINVGQRRVAQIVRQKLLQSFPHSDGEYSIHLTVEEETSSLAVRRDATESRLRLSLAAFLTLQNTKGDVVFKRDFTVSSAYNVEDSPFGTDAGRDHARLSASAMLVDEVIDIVNLYLHQNMPKAE